MKRGGPLPRYTELRSYNGLRQGKPIRARNPERRRRLYREQFGSYAELVRSLPCLVCERTPCDPHHVKSRGAGGKQSDLVPLCREHHRWYHLRGHDSFEQTYQLDLEAEAASLWEEYGG
jgi:hypothetical protein